METERYLLREVQQSDIENIYRGLSNQEITKYYDVHFSTLQETQEQMDWYANLKKDGTGIWWCIESKENREFYGAAGFNSLDSKHQKAEIGLWLLKEYWGRGILKEVMPKLFEYGFKELGLHRIEGYVVSDNVKCKRALEKINFKCEGTMRECEVNDGIRISVDIYSILATEWNNTVHK